MPLLLKHVFKFMLKCRSKTNLHFILFYYSAFDSTHVLLLEISISVCCKMQAHFLSDLTEYLDIQQTSSLTTHY